VKHRLLAALRCLAIAGLLAAPALAKPPASPDLAVRTLGGDDFDLAKLQGHVVLIHFWATWCPPCIKEMPALEAFYERYRARGVEILALSEDRTRDIDEVHHMVHHMNMTYPVAMAHKASRNSFGDPSALPVTFVVDAKGVVRAEMRPDTQPVTEENLMRIVDPLLGAP
jgi:cytochrome c biogenesis protein CcmG/thiol:disulfide interchange protein DsbE